MARQAKPAGLERFLNAMGRIADVERSAPVTEWRYRGIDVWPIIKYVLVKQLIMSAVADYRPPARFEKYPAFAKGMRKLHGTGWRFWQEVETTPFDWRQHYDLDTVSTADVLLFGSSSAFVELAGKYLNHHQYALRRRLEELGLRTFAFHSGTIERDPSTIEWGDRIASIDPLVTALRSLYVPKLTRSLLGRHFRKLDDVIAATGQDKAALCAFADTQIARVAAAAGHLDTLLTEVRPRAVFTSNYASTYGWATAHACRRHRIPFVDMQHGIQGRYNGSYFWEATPADDWNVVPTGQLSWTSSDAELFMSGHPARKAAVAGPPWLQLAREFPGNAAAPNLRRNPGDAVFLYTGQTDTDYEDAIALAKAGLTVIYRAHPTRRAKILAGLDDETKAALNCDFGSNAPLCDVLAVADAIVTGYSATILEAALLGMPILATGIYAALLQEDYAAELGDELTIVSAGERPLVDAVLEWARKVEPRHGGNVSSASATNALAELGLGL